MAGGGDNLAGAASEVRGTGRNPLLALMVHPREFLRCRIRLGSVAPKLGLCGPSWKEISSNDNGSRYLHDCVGKGPYKGYQWAEGTSALVGQRTAEFR